MCEKVRYEQNREDISVKDVKVSECKEQKTSEAEGLLVKKDIENYCIPRFDKIKEWYLSHCGSRYKPANKPYTATIEEIEKMVVELDINTKQRLLLAIRLKKEVNESLLNVESTLSNVIVSGGALLTSVLTLLSGLSDFEGLVLWAKILAVITLIAFMVSIGSYFRNGKRRSYIAGFCGLFIDVLEKDLKNENQTECTSGCNKSVENL